MRPAQGGDDSTEIAAMEGHLKANLTDALEVAGLADGGIRTLRAKERALASHREGTVCVGTDLPRIRLGERGANLFKRRLRNEDHEFVRVVGVAARDVDWRSDCADVMRRGIDHFDEPIVDAASNCVERGVRRVDRDTRANRVDRDAPLPRRAVEAFERFEEERVVADDEIGAGRACLGEDGGRDVNREKHAADFAAVARDEEPHAIPLFRE